MLKVVSCNINLSVLYDFAKYLLFTGSHAEQEYLLFTGSHDKFSFVEIGCKFITMHLRLGIESFAIINLRNVSTNYTYIQIFVTLCNTFNVRTCVLSV